MAEWRANDRDLNPPANIAGFVDRTGGNPKVKIQWFQDQAPPTDPPVFGIQVWNDINTTNPNIWQSNIWRLPYVIPYIEVFWSYNHGAWGTGTRSQQLQQVAQRVRDRVLQIRNLILQYHPNVNFRWAWWPHRYASDSFVDGNHTVSPYITTALFDHYNDRVTIPGQSVPVSSVFSANGRAEFKSLTLEAVSYLKPLLVAEGIPDPVFVDPDYENGAPVPFRAVYNRITRTSIPESDAPYNLAQWHNWVKNDPRANTELIDGNVTYNQWAASLTDWNGDPFPESYLYPFVYDSSPTAAARVGAIYSSLGSRIVDWGLHDALYTSCKQYFPNTVCGNWLTFASSRSTRSNGYRFRESPYNFGPNMKADFSMPALYGFGLNDNYEPWPGFQWPLNSGYDTFYEHLYWHNIDESLYQNVPNGNVDLYKRLYCETANNILRGQKENAPNKIQALSIAWQSPNIYPFGNTINANPVGGARRWPQYMNNASWNFINSPEVFVELIKQVRKYNVRIIEVFAQNGNKTAMDQMYTQLPTALESAGYTV